MGKDVFMNIVLLSGGSGKRLWPLSNDIRSKQFIKIFKAEDGAYESMVQRVYRQLKQVDSEVNITIATSRTQISAIHNQLGEGVSISLEPCRRDTFPAIALATAYLHDVQGVSEEESVVVCPVDPYVETDYFEALKRLGEQADKGEANLVLMGIEPYHLWKDEEDHSKGDIKDGVPLQPSYEQQDEIFQAFIDRYPNLTCIARHVRYAHSGSENSLKAFMWYEGHTFESKLFTFNILDRVGGGDAFASGLIYAIMNHYKPMDIVNFAVASSAIKHTIRGDANITDDAAAIRNLMNMNYDIKR